MPIPHERYCLFMMTRGDDEAAIKKRCEELGLVPPDDAEFGALEDKMAKVLPEHLLRIIEKKAHRPRDFLKWMDALDLREAWQTEKDYQATGARQTFKHILELMEDSRIRLAMEGLLLHRQNPNDIAHIIASRFLTSVTALHVQLFQKYFFDPSKLKRRDWKSYLERLDGRAREIYLCALTEDIETMKTELDLPANISVGSTLQYMLVKASNKAKMYLADNLPESGKEARNWIGAATKLVDKYEKYRTKDAADLSKSIQMEFDYVESDYEEADAALLSEVQERKDADPEKKK